MRLSLCFCPAAAGHATTPSVGSLKPAMMRNAVDFPQPDGPSSVTNSPCRISRSSPASACVPLGNALPTPRSATSGAECMAAVTLESRLSFRPQIEPHLLVDELQGVGFAVVEIGLGDAGTHHFIEEIFHVCVGHRAHAKRLGIAGIDDAVLLHLGD